MSTYPRIKIVEKDEDEDDVLEIPKERMFKINNIDDFMFISDSYSGTAIYLRSRTINRKGTSIEWEIGEIGGNLYLIPLRLG